MTLTYAGQNKEVVFADVTFNNERQKAEVTVVKQDKDTKKPLEGGIFRPVCGRRYQKCRWCSCCKERHPD